MFDVWNFMFDYPFEFFTMVIAIAALIFARKALNQATALRARLDLFEAAAREKCQPATHSHTLGRRAVQWRQLLSK